MTYPSNKIYLGKRKRKDKPQTLQEDILRAIYDLFIEDSEPITVRTITDRVDITKDAVYRRMLALEQDGYLWRDRRGKYGKWYLSERGLKRLSPNPAKGSYEHERYKFLTKLAGQAKDKVLS